MSTRRIPCPLHAESPVVLYSLFSTMAFVGIDLGTTTSEIAVFDEKDGPRIIKDTRGNEVVDSYFGFDNKTKKPRVGEAAKSTAHSNPELVVEQVKRKMGEDVDLHVGDQTYTPTEVSAQILRYLRKSAERELDEDVDRCVITVPANFPDPARRATKQAGEIAGMKVERIINEPTAAALAYGYAEDVDEEQVLVYDLGGGTFDVSVVEYMEDIVNVQASSGDTTLGGKDFDEALVEHVATAFENEHGIAIEPGSGNYYRLLFACEDAKKDLSFSRSVAINIPFFAVKDGQPVSLDVTVTRQTFERLIRPMVDRTESAIDTALADAELSRSDIDRVILVGGSTRIPYVRDFVESVMGQPPFKRVDPDKAVALGAAVQTGIVDGTSDNIIMDVCPLSLGTAVIEKTENGLQGGRYSEIIPTNSRVLQRHNKVYHTAKSDQTSINLRVYQRDSQSQSQQAEINEVPNVEEGFTLLDKQKVDVPPGLPKQDVNITYVYNPNGLLDVTVEFPAAGVEHEFQAHAGLDEEAIIESREKVEDAWKESDLYEEVEALLDIARFDLRDGEIPDEKEPRLRSLIEEMKEALAQNDRSRVEELEDDITDLMFELS